MRRLGVSFVGFLGAALFFSFSTLMPATTWQPITEADLLAQISGDELAAYRDAALADGQTDPVAESIAQVTEDVRGYVAGCRQNVLGPDGTIPVRLMRDAVALVIVDIPGRVGRTPKPVREQKGKAALDKLAMVARCAYAIADPAPGQAATTESESTAMPSFSGRQRRDARAERDGL